MTRKKEEVWLIGHAISDISVKKLPSHGDVIRRLFHLVHANMTVNEASLIVCSEILKVWNMANIPTADHRHVAKKIR